MSKSSHKFGKYAVIEPITYVLKEEPNWYWEFKPPTARDELNLQQFLFQRRTRTTRAGETEQIPPTIMEVTFHQLALTFGGTNIPMYELKDGDWVETGKPILGKDAAVEEIKDVLGEMPSELVLELWEALGEHVPNWGPESDSPKA
jgi:hypothetical protein